MSREILFRGQDYAKNWHYGVPLVFSENFICMTAPHIYNISVNPETVGECSFVPDKNGVMMYEGDIVTGLFLFGMSINAVVAFKNGAFGLEWDRGGVNTFTAFTSLCNVEYEVIGNVHDNPELLN